MSEVCESCVLIGGFLKAVLGAGLAADADPTLVTGNAAGLATVNVLLILL